MAVCGTPFLIEPVMSFLGPSLRDHKPENLICRVPIVMSGRIYTSGVRRSSVSIKLNHG